MMDFLIIIESYICNLGILILITIIQKYLDVLKMYESLFQIVVRTQ